MPQSKLVLVTGATGKQGGAVVEALLTRGHQVRALTRNSASPAANRLRQQGVEIAVGDFTDHDSLVRAARGADVVYAMSTPYEQGAEQETAQGITITDAAKAAGVAHFIYSSVASANRATGISHFDGKYAVEKHLLAPGYPTPSSPRSSSWRICCSRGCSRVCVRGSSRWHCLAAARCNKSPWPTSGRALRRSLNAGTPLSVVALISPGMS